MKHKLGYLCRFSFLSLFGFSLLGCVNLPDVKKPPMNLYYLEVLALPKKLHQSNQKRFGWQLTIEEPTADTRFDSDYVIVNSGESRVNYIKNIRWIARLPLLVQEVFTTIFEQSDIAKGVGNPSEGLDSEYVLLTDIKSFQLDVVQAPSIFIQIYVRLMSADNRELIGAQLFSKKIPINSETPSDVMEGFVQGINQVTWDIIEWVKIAGRDFKTISLPHQSS